MIVVVERTVKSQDKVTDVFSLECKVSQDVIPAQREKIRKKVEETLVRDLSHSSRLSMMAIFMSSVSVWVAGNLTFNS